MTHRLAALTWGGVSAFELGIAVEVFGYERPELEADWWYELAVCAERPGPLATLGGFDLVAPPGLDVLVAADTVLVPRTPDIHADPPAAVLDALRTAHARGARI